MIRYDVKTTGVADGKPMLEDGQVLDVANVYPATGFARTIAGSTSRVSSATTAGRSVPVGSSPAASGLYFLGVPFQWAFASMNVFGVGRDAKYVVDHVAGHATERGPERTMGTVPA